MTRNLIIMLKSREFYEWKIETLIDWSRDVDAEVRNWSTTAISARNDDSAEVRGALLDRVEDDDFDTKSEAIVGLARRRDGRVIPYLQKELGGDRVGELFVEAAGYISSPELIPELTALLAWWDVDKELLREALKRCKGSVGPSARAWEYVG